MTKVTVYGLIDDSLCTVENARTNEIVLHGSGLDNVYTINLDHSFLMLVSRLKVSHQAWL